MKNNSKILVAVSGGVDSFTSALLLKQQGYDVVCCILQMHQHNENAIKDAIKLCESVKIELIIKNVSKQFLEIVKENFYKEYLNGRTPNPCVLCNKEVKFKELIAVADANNIELIATGHYAIVEKDNTTGRYYIAKANDISKDQSYMLWRLNQNELKRIIFPVGKYAKFTGFRS